ncbi:MAG: transcription antitermination factor NusB [Deinococcales bacterium]
MSKARQLSLELLRRVQHGAFASNLLSKSLNEKVLTSQDKSLVTDLLYGALRYQHYLRFRLRDYLSKADRLPEDVLNILQLGAYEILLRGTAKHAAVSEWVNLSKGNYNKLSGLVNAVLRKFESSLNPEELKEAAKLSVPSWLFEAWQDLFGEQASDIALAMNKPEPLWLYSYHPQSKESLEAEGCQIRYSHLGGRSLGIQSPKPLHQLRAYQEGMVQAQNPASAHIVQLLEPQKGERVLDLCSGNGIKAAQMAALGADVTSVELNESNMHKAQKNLKRLKLAVKHVVFDLQNVPGLEPSTKVLLDAPCSGTGTLRGHPEIRLRLEKKDLSKFVNLQKNLLKTAATLTAPGGALVYAVCTLTKAEGLDIIEDFLQQQPNFIPQKLSLSVPHQAFELGSYILPLEGLDGFFVSRLIRT